tara:strand:- start:2873 stop:3679 length:807 start_codon:yes stop_codon:yes gene_type:complete
VSILKLIEIFSAWRRGRVLRKRLDAFDFGEISWKSTTGSTNQDLMLKAQTGRNHLSVALADYQTAGKGRKQRQWISEKGSALLMSVLFEVDAVSDLVSLYSMKLSVSAVRALEHLGFSEVRIKWPNDLVTMHEGKPHKLAGILAQSTIRGSHASVVVGLGLNISLINLRDLLPHDRISALSEIGQPPEVIDLAEGILREILSSDLTNETLLAEYEKYSHTLGTNVRVEVDEDMFEGLAKRITQTGSLIIKLENGFEREISVGEIIHLR